MRAYGSIAFAAALSLAACTDTTARTAIRDGSAGSARLEVYVVEAAGGG